MKKRLFNVVALAALVCSFMACGNSTSKDENKDSADVKNKQEVVDDKQTVAPQSDATDQDTERGTEEAVSGKEGFGRCLQSGCYCKGFEGRGQTCRNCGHAYKRHY